METATKAQIQFLTKLQAEWAADEADGMPYTIRYSSFEEFLAATDWSTQTLALQVEVTQEHRDAVASGAAPRLTSPDMTVEEKREARRAHTAAVKAEVARRLAVLQESNWVARQRMYAAADASTEGLSKAEASALIDALN